MSELVPRHTPGNLNDPMRVTQLSARYGVVHVRVPERTVIRRVDTHRTVIAPPGDALLHVAGDTGNIVTSVCGKVFNGSAASRPT